MRWQQQPVEVELLQAQANLWMDMTAQMCREAPCEHCRKMCPPRQQDLIDGSTERQMRWMVLCSGCSKLRASFVVDLLRPSDLN